MASASASAAPGNSCLPIGDYNIAIESFHAASHAADCPFSSFNISRLSDPHVAGIAALIWNKLPQTNNKSLRSVLTTTAEDQGVSGRDSSYGFGLIQAQAAFNFLNSQAQCIATEPGKELSCNDTRDNDCDGLIDAGDGDCASSGSCQLGQSRAACVNNSDCCSNSCKGKPGRKTCS